jgi:outer membrane immunogenic protein
MKFGKTILTLIVAGCASGAVMAQGTWTGFYIGLNAGHASAKSDVNTQVSDDGTGYFLTSEVAAINALGSGRVKPAGFTGGLTMGYNWHFGHGFFGFEGDYDHFNQGDSRTITFADPLPAGVCPGPTGIIPCTYTLWQNVDVSNLATIRARGGWANEHWLIYGTAGGAHTSVNYSEVFTDTYGGAYEASWQSHSKGGFVWGIGAEGRWTKHWSIKGEWLHSHFSVQSGAGGLLTAYTPSVSFPTSLFTHSNDLSVDVARVGVNYRF